MRKLGVVEFVTLDGVMQSFGGPNEDREGGFDYGGWGAPYLDPAMAGSASLSQSIVYLLGRKTYQAMAANWPHRPADDQMAAHLNSAEKHVATRTLKNLDWSNAHVLEGDLVPAVNRLKASGDGNIVVLGSGMLVEELNREGLIDQFRLFVHPLLLGKGKRLFRDLSTAPTSAAPRMHAYQNRRADAQLRGRLTNRRSASSTNRLALTER